MLWHAGDRIIRFNRGSIFGLGAENCSAFESVHQEVAKKIGDILSKDLDSDPYRDQLKSQMNQFNDIHLNVSSFASPARNNIQLGQLGDADIELANLPMLPDNDEL